MKKWERNLEKENEPGQEIQYLNNCFKEQKGKGITNKSVRNDRYELLY